MSDKPILFSAPMILALLDGRKTQTRRVLKPQPEADGKYHDIKAARRALRFVPGDRLWVREAWQEFLASEFPQGRAFGPRGDFGIPTERAKGNVSYVAYRADGDFPPHPEDGKAVWRPPIHMPRKFSRLTLIVEAVKVERLQDISEEDAGAEGYPAQEQRAASGIAEIRDAYPIAWYAWLWDSINAKRGFPWSINPWVCALTFCVIKQNIDATPPPRRTPMTDVKELVGALKHSTALLHMLAVDTSQPDEVRAQIDENETALEALSRDRAGEQEPVAVKVRELVWGPITYGFIADALWGRYRVELSKERWSWGLHWAGSTGYALNFCDTPDEAKAAAQADYEKRILSALTAPPDTAAIRRQALEEAAEIAEDTSGSIGPTIARAIRSLAASPPVPDPRDAEIDSVAVAQEIADGCYGDNPLTRYAAQEYTHRRPRP